LIWEEIIIFFENFNISENNIIISVELGFFLSVLADYLGGGLFELSSDLVLELELEPGPSSRIGWNWCNTEIWMTKF